MIDGFPRHCLLLYCFYKAARPLATPRSLSRYEAFVPTIAGGSQGHLPPETCHR